MVIDWKRCDKSFGVLECSDLDLGGCYTSEYI